MILELYSFLDNKKISYEKDLSLSNKTWIKTGGICACWIAPVSVAQLTEICRYLYSNHIVFDLVGQTSNIFFHSTYNPQVVVSTVKVNNYEINYGIITSDCGVSVVKLAKDCLSKGYAGFYGLVGLPGTVASAAVNNASCFNCSISSMLVSADVLLPGGTVQTIEKKDFLYSHRSSAFKRGEMKGIILSVKLKLVKAEDIDEEYRKSEETKIYRKNKQEGPNRNLGSVFSTRRRKKNMKNRLSAFIAKITSVFCPASKNHIYKCMLLWLYGYSDLKHYISDKNINIFIWHDINAEHKFIRYKQFMSKVHNKIEMEIEEKVI